jgi:hypothetical protein
LYQGLLDDCKDDNLLHTHLEESKAKLEAHYQAHYAKLISTPVFTQSSTSSMSVHSPQKVDLTSRYNKHMCLNIDEIGKLNCCRKALLWILFSGGQDIMLNSQIYLV